MTALRVTFLVDDSGTERPYAYCLHKYDAIVAPGVGDDELDGYSVGSQVHVPAAGEIYDCHDPTTGAAVWELRGTGGGAGAPDDAPYYVTTAHAGLSAEVVVPAYIQTLLDDVDAATARGTLGLGTAAVAASTDFAAAIHTHAQSDVTDLVADLALKAPLASPTFTGEVTIPNTGLHLLDTNASHDLIVKPGSNITADRTLTLTTGDADRTLTISGDTTLGGGSHSGTNTGDQTIAGLSPLTTKGDLFTFSTVNARRSVGANNALLVANSSDATGLAWSTGLVWIESVKGLQITGSGFGVFTINQGTITANTPFLQLTSTWNNAGETFIAETIDVTDNASAAGSLIVRWRVSGATMLSVSKAGNTVVAGTLAASNLSGTNTGDQTIATIGLLNALTDADPALADVLPGYDTSAAANRDFRLDYIGALLNPAICQLRPTLETGVPVSSTDQLAKTTVFFTPFKGNRIALFDGTRWVLYAVPERSLALGTVTADLPYDFFLYDNAGTVTLEKVAWTNSTTRATGLVLQDDVHVKSGATTRRYVFTLTPTSTTAAEDSDAKRSLWPPYNQVLRRLMKLEDTDTWNYTTATYRQMNASTANKVRLVNGLYGNAVDLTLHAAATSSVVGQGYASIGEDSTTTPDAGAAPAQLSISNTAVGSTPCGKLVKSPAIGVREYMALEKGIGSGVTTWYGDAGIPNDVRSGLRGWWLC